jgi:hypothetical protein
MRSTSVLAAAGLLLMTVACGGGSTPTSPSDTTGGGAGSFNVRITDSPYGSAKAVLVTFSDVSVHRDGNWTKLPFLSGSTRTCDLKKLQNSAQEDLFRQRGGIINAVRRIDRPARGCVVSSDDSVG